MKDKVVPKAVAVIAAFFLWMVLGGGIKFFGNYLYHYFRGDLSDLYIPEKQYIIDLAGILFTICVLFLSFFFRRRKRQQKR
jgi:hypothetical protein